MGATETVEAFPTAIGVPAPQSGLVFVKDVSGWLESEGAARCEDWRDESGFTWRFTSASEMSRERDPVVYQAMCAVAGFSADEIDRGEWVVRFASTRDDLRREMWRLYDPKPDILHSRFAPLMVVCPECAGSGLRAPQVCLHCAGTGSLAEQPEIDARDAVVTVTGDIGVGAGTSGLVLTYRGGGGEIWDDGAGTRWSFFSRPTLAIDRRKPRVLSGGTGEERYRAACREAGFSADDEARGTVVTSWTAVDDSSDASGSETTVERTMTMWRLSEPASFDFTEPHEGTPLVRRLFPVRVTCSECDGRGSIDVRCSACNGGYQFASVGRAQST